MKTRRFLTVCFFQLCLFLNSSLKAQATMPESSYLIDLMRAEAHEIHEIEGKQIRLRFSDRYGKNPTFGLTVLDWESGKLAEISLAKQYGDNDFELDLDLLGVAFEYGKDRKSVV